jgi:hypothetical protein
MQGTDNTRSIDVVSMQKHYDIVSFLHFHQQKSFDECCVDNIDEMNGYSKLRLDDVH